MQEKAVYLMLRLCCQVNPYLVCGMCKCLFCEICWNLDQTHVKRGRIEKEALYCPKAGRYISTYNWEAVFKLRKKYNVPWALTTCPRRQLDKHR